MIDIEILPRNIHPKYAKKPDALLQVTGVLDALLQVTGAIILALSFVVVESGLSLKSNDDLVNLECVNLVPHCHGTLA